MGASRRRYRGLVVVLAALVVLAIVVPAGADASTRETLAINWRLGNAALLIHDGYGHLSKADPSRCVIEATGRYLVDLSTPPPGTVCPCRPPPLRPRVRPSRPSLRRWAERNPASKGGTMDATRKLYRSRTNRKVAGVCGGLAQYFNTDATVIRVLFVVLAVLGGSGLLIYLAMWIIVPSEP